MDYEDFDIRFETDEEGEGSVCVTSSPAGRAREAFSTARFAAELGAYRTDLDRDGLRSGADPVEGDPTRELEDGTPVSSSGSERFGGSAKALGRALFYSLFTGKVLKIYQESLHYLGDEIDRALRIRLSFDPGSRSQLRLCALPWELLRNGSSDLPMALDRRLAVVRTLQLRRPVRRPYLEPPVRTLVAAPNPPGSRPLDLDREVQEIKNAWQDGGQVKVLHQPTLAELRQELVAAPYHQLHFAGHGTFKRVVGEGFLDFLRPDGSRGPVASHDLVTALRDHTTLRLVVLNACLSGAVGSEAGADSLAGAAVALALAEVPYVVGQKLRLEDSAAVAFGSTLHRRLAAGDPVETAIVEARQTLLDLGRSVHPSRNESSVWATPTLYAQLELGGTIPFPEERVQVRRALEALGSDQLTAVATDLDPGGVLPSSNPLDRELPVERRDRVEKLLDLAAGQGEEAWLDLQEWILAVRSPFSPFDGSFRSWDLHPSGSWQLSEERLVGVGFGADLFPEAPPELREGSLLTWKGLRFRDGMIQARLWISGLGREGSAGLVLRHQPHGLVLGIVRSSQEGRPRSEIWQADGLGWRCLASGELRSPAGDGGWHDLTLGVRGLRIELTTNGSSPLASAFAGEGPAGHCGLVRFGSTSVEAKNLLLTVWRRAAPGASTRASRSPSDTTEKTAR